MSLSMKMEYNVQILRGWPYDGAADRAEPITSGVTLSNGDWVQKASDNTVGLVGSTKTAAAGLVIRGNGDSGSGAYTGKATVLWGGFIAQIKNLPSSVTFTPGASLTIQNGKVQLGVVGTDPIIGHVLDVLASSSTQDASIVAYIR
jgi:hypothetical protein